MDRVLHSPTAKIVANFRFGHASGLPSAVKVLEDLRREARLSLIPKDQVRLGNGPVLPEIPGFADFEIPQEIGGGV